MRFVTLNAMHGASPADGRVDAERIAAALAALDPDVLALQEVDRHQPRSDGVDLTTVAAQAMGAAHVRYAPTLAGTPGRRWRPVTGDDLPDGPSYGTALLTRADAVSRVHRFRAVPVVLPVLAGRAVVLAREEPRAAVVASLTAGTEPLTVVATHLAFVPGWNAVQLRRLAQAVADRPGPVVLLGDLNVGARTAARVTGYRSVPTGPTFPAARPRWTPDHVLLRGPVRVHAVRTEVLSFSDHRAVVVDLEPGRADRGDERFLT